MKINSFFRSIIKPLVLTCLCLIQNPLYSQNKKFVNPTPGEITIMASSPIPHGLEPKHEYFKDLVECGFNLGCESGSVAWFNKLFSYIGDLNFKYLIVNPDLRTEKRTDFIKAFKNSPYLGGWVFYDEPTYDVLNSLVAPYNALYAADPNTLIYMNLIGYPYSQFTGPIKQYSKYLDLVERLFAPPIWSFDYYFVEIKNGKIQTTLDGYYNALECMRNISKSTNRPFWAYLQSMAFKNDYWQRPPAKYEYLSCGAFSALAYGAQGILYWTYGQRKSNDKESYQSALVNLDGKKTPAWYAAQKVNLEIKKYNDVFYQCDVKEVRHTGKKLYQGTKRLSGAIGPFKMVRTGDSGVLVSYIENKGNKYVVIVNHDVLRKQKITLELNSNRIVTDLTASSPTQYNWRKDIKLTLDKGGYVIFKVIQ